MGASVAKQCNQTYGLKLQPRGRKMRAMKAPHPFSMYGDSK